MRNSVATVRTENTIGPAGGPQGPDFFARLAQNSQISRVDWLDSRPQTRFNRRRDILGVRSVIRGGIPEVDSVR